MEEKDDKLREKVKTSFGQMDRKAPDLLWRSLSASLDEAASTRAGNTPGELSLYQKIRESFSAQGKKAPSHVWQSINRQLNIDLVWTRIDRELDGAGSVERHWWRWAAAASVLLLLAGFAGAYFVEWEKAVTLPGRKAETAVAATKTPVAGEHVTGFGIENGHPNAPHTNDEQQKLPQPSIGESLAGHQAKRQEEGMMRSKVREVIPAPAPRIFDNTGLSDTGIASSFAEEGGETSTGGLGEHEFAPLLETRQAALRPITGLNPVAFDSVEYRHMAQVESDAAAKGPRKRLMLARVSLGLAVSYNSSWLLNNETQRSFDKGSLISTSPTFKESAGLTLGYHLGHRSFASAELHMAKAGQEYKTFRGGSYTKRGLELTYYKGYVQYQHRFLPDRKSLLSNITLRAGLFAGLLHERRGELRDTESSYSQYDYGVRGALGQERRVGGLTIGYGVSVERGLKNIFLGSESMPGRFNRTYTLNAGPYLSVRLGR
ncbi:hypothetical protein ACFSRY_18745 [Pontibacter locisalis]|uniref:Outer membrane protein beta-barrel domain-containing protein n=1 Tax=Pontibacter locisalis TaxID=1719035 RepID=A0ABW5IQH7_9BACT